MLRRLPVTLRAEKTVCGSFVFGFILCFCVASDQFVCSSALPFAFLLLPAADWFNAMPRTAKKKREEGKPKRPMSGEFLLHFIQFCIESKWVLCCRFLVLHAREERGTGERSRDHERPRSEQTGWGQMEGHDWEREASLQDQGWPGQGKIPERDPGLQPAKTSPTPLEIFSASCDPSSFLLFLFYQCQFQCKINYCSYKFDCGHYLMWKIFTLWVCK